MPLKSNESFCCLDEENGLTYKGDQAKGQAFMALFQESLNAHVGQRELAL